MTRSVLLISICLLLLQPFLNGQQRSRLHIVTTRDNRQGTLKLHCTVNGKLFKLLPGKCLEMEMAGDSLHVVMTDNRWIKKETVDLHIPVEEDMYVHVFWGRRKEDPKWMVRSMAEQVCKACFDELKKKCRKTIPG